MHDFTPTSYFLATIPLGDSEETLNKVRAEFTSRYGEPSSCYTVDYGLLVFVNKHPDAPEIIFEVQALTVALAKSGTELTSEIAKSVADLELQWRDITVDAISYHANAKLTGDGGAQ
jgi:hypothetical protein